MSKNQKILLLHWNGRFGNRMFTYAFMRHYAEQFNIDLWLPSTWEGDVLFRKGPHRIVPDDELRLYLNQTMKEWDNLDARLLAIDKYNKRVGDSIAYMNPDVPEEYGKLNICIDSLCSYHPSIFPRYSREKMINEYFRFSEEVLSSDLFKRMEDRQGTYTIAHLRRDDVSNTKNITNLGYSVISKQSYERAFKKYDVDPTTVEWVTDDRTGQWGVGCPQYQDSWSYPEGSAYFKDIFFSWFPDFLKLMFAKTVFRANSSFSWWAAFLSKGEVFSPRLHARQLIHQSGRELDVEFEKGNHPHWMCVKGVDQCDDIIIN